MKKIVPSMVVLASLAACSLAPTLNEPALEIPARYKEQPPEERGTWKPAQPAESMPRGEWWKVFNDPVLNELEAHAVAANQNLKISAARVAEARALLGTAKADNVPQVNAGFGPARSKSSPASQGLPDGTDIPPTTMWRGLLTASYEVDLFGRVAETIKAAQNDYAANLASFHSVLLALQADVAQAYFALRETDEELTLLRDTVRLRGESARLLERRYELGDISELDFARAKTEFAVARSDAVALERQRAQLEHGLAVLLGKPPASFDLAPAPLATVMPTIPTGLPSRLLERRPDISAAQRTMAAANARIGVAKSAFFPLLRLTAQGGVESAELSDLFKWSSRTWALGPLLGTVLSMPLIDGGRNQANLDRSYAVLDQSVADYRQRVLVAFSEVEDSLAALRTLRRQAEATHDAEVFANRAFKISSTRYDAGASNYLDVIDAQRSLLAIQRLNTQISGARASATVVLIRALGGGWETPEAVSENK